MQKVIIFVKKNFVLNIRAKDKKDHKVGHHCYYTGEYRGTAHRLCNLRYGVHKEILIVLANWPSCDYHFIIKVLA